MVKDSTVSYQIIEMFFYKSDISFRGVNCELSGRKIQVRLNVNPR